MNQSHLWSKWSLSLVLALLVTVHFLRHYQLLVAHDYPAGLDPYYFAAASEAITKQLPVRPLDSFMIDSTNNHYPPLLWWTIGLISQTSSLTVNSLLIWLGPILGALTIPIAYWTFRRVVSPWGAVAGAAAYTFAPFVFTRTYLTLPENVAVIWFLIILWLFWGTFSWKKLVIGLTIWLLMFLTHLTAFYVPVILGLWLCQPNLLKRYWRWYGIGLAVMLIAIFGSPIRSSISTLWQLSQTSVIGWSPPTYQFIDQYVSIELVFLGLAGFGLAGLTWRHPLSKKLLCLAIPFLILTLFYKTQIKDFGPIWPERFIIYTAIPTALLATWFLEQVINAYNPARLTLTFAIVIIMVVSIFTPAFYWFWPFSSEEVQAARWLSTHTPDNSVIITQPLLNWLIRAQARRSVLWTDADRQPPTIALPSIQAMKDRWGNFSSRPFYIFVSRTKLANPYPAEFLTGHWAPVGYPDRLLPKYDEQLFNPLPKIYQTQAVTIYVLNPNVLTSGLSSR